MDLVQKIKTTLSIEDVVADYLELHKKGKVYKALCPFHNEKTPSFVITPEKGLAYCFGCHTGGDMFEFIQKMENVDFPESIRILAKKSGLEGELKGISFSGKKKSEQTPIFDFHRDITVEYEKILYGKEGEDALKYLKKRNVEDSTIKAFHIGYAKDSWEFAKEFAEKTDLTEKQMLDTGAFVKNEKGSVYDRFRNRILFPLTNTQGSIVGYSGRTLDKNDPAKYVNSADSPIFSKKNTLFGIYQARQAIKNINYIIVTEGQFDVVLLHQIGIKNVVASSGTAFTTEHLKIISYLTRNIVFCFDSDKAGITASKKAIELAVKNDFSVKVVVLPAKKDPADIVLEKGQEEMVKYITEAKSPFTFYYDMESKHLDVDTAQGKKDAIRAMFPLIQSFDSLLDKNETTQLLAANLKISENDIESEMKRIQRDFKGLTSSKNKKKEKLKAGKVSLMERVFAFLITFPVCFEHIDILDDLIIYMPKKWKTVYIELKEYYNGQGVKINVTSLESIHGTSISELTVYFDSTYQDWKTEDLILEFQSLVRRLKTIYKKKRLKEISLEIREAEIEKDSKKIEILMNETKDWVKRWI